MEKTTLTKEEQNLSKSIYFLLKITKIINSLDKESAKNIFSQFNADQELIDYLNGLLVDYDNSIAQEQQTKNNLDQAIQQQENNIAYFEDQKTQADVNIAEDEQDKVYVNELIVIVENQPPSN